MSEFYGRLHGNRGEATRCGSKVSGIDATVESWSSVVRTRHFETGNGKRLITIDFETKYGNRLIGPLTFDLDAFTKHYTNPEVAFRAQKLEAAARDLRDEIENAKRTECPRCGGSDFDAANGECNEPGCDYPNPQEDN